ncbi:MAG: globin domain-containing protein [Cytophagales bacterium]|nr:globin domain-containing protein [Bernardetiaceae bacterium]MDW8210567.1 globin domain-containing protein [Cytophagales bacterium]
MQTVNPESIQIVKDTWAELIGHGPEIGERFYNRLFQQYPAYKKLFKNNPHDQHRKLAFAITLVVTKLNKIDQIAEEVRSLAMRHVKYGVQPEYFKPFIKLLVETIAEVRGERWKPEHTQAWREVMEAIGNAIAANIKSVQEKAHKNK